MQNVVGQKLSELFDAHNLSRTIEYYSRLKVIGSDLIVQALCQAIKQQLMNFLKEDFDVQIIGSEMFISRNGGAVNPEDLIIEDVYNFTHELQRDFLHKVNDIKLNNYKFAGLEKDTLVNARVMKVLPGLMIGDLDGREIVVNKRNMVHMDRVFNGQNIKLLIQNVFMDKNSVKLIGTRRGELFVQKVLEEVIPELVTGDIMVKEIVRYEGVKTFVFVTSSNQNIEPVKVCLGIRGVRAQEIRRHLTEKMEILPVPKDVEDLCRALFREQLISCLNNKLMLKPQEEIRFYPDLEVKLIRHMFDVDIDYEIV